MKSRLTLIFAALVLLLGGMVWMMQDHISKTVAPGAAAQPTVAMHVEPLAAPAGVPTTAAIAVVPGPQQISSPMVSVDPSGRLKYVARAGDTVSQLAIALLGSDSKEHRDAIIAANPALQSNPDRVLEGYAYSITPVTVPATTASRKQEAPTVMPAIEDKASEKPLTTAVGPTMKYTAQAGDTVHVLAADLLGGDTQANRDAIIAGNRSLQENPDHLVVGKSYTIAAPNGLAANPSATATQAPTSQPDADDLAKLSMGRTLRYTAKPGDTVSKLAVALLGSDTSVNRDLIIQSNASLKRDPDHLEAGRTYWIAAPTAAATR